MTDAAARPMMTRIEVPDHTLGLRGKLLRADKAAPGKQSTFCTILYGFSLDDGVTDTAFSSGSNGYPDLPLRLDESTRVRMPWLGGMEAVIAEHLDADGRPFGASPRAALQRVLAGYAERGIEPVLGFEFEFWIFHGEDRSRPQGAIDALGRVTNAYNLSRISEANGLIDEFVTRMDQIGVPIEAFHSELGPGLFEFTLSPLPALQAADAAVRARQHMRELCAERGLQASFMAKPFGGESGAGGHVHSSLVVDGENVFASAPGELSETASRYVAGLLATMPDMTALFAPYVNSYKRIDPTQYVANRPSWGTDDRSASCRTLLASVAAARVEHRVSGADTSPYFSAAGILAGGLHGISEELDLEATAAAAQPLPASLSDATARFAASPVADERLGRVFVETVAAVQRSEVRDYEQWLRSNITEWERARHLEHH